MKLAGLKLTKHALLLIAGAMAFIAAFVWLLATSGPLAPVGVETATAARADLSPAVYGIGTVEAQHDYSVGPIQAGRVLRVWVDQGEPVKAGQLLAEIDPVDLRQRAEAASTSAAPARQAPHAAQAQVTQAQSRA
ncbi:MAG: biotin/lipoyl-binding protein, partial [Thiobacillus sp.]|nr:biotin/lipoyl-binding protein [Thiobacillus sp.]